VRLLKISSHEHWLIRAHHRTCAAFNPVDGATTGVSANRNVDGRNRVLLTPADSCRKNQQLRRRRERYGVPVQGREAGS